MRAAELMASTLPLLLLLAAAASAASLPGCPSTCGAVDIPYPFGIGSACSREGFDLSCNATTKKLFWSDVEIVNISLSEGQIRVLNEISWQCYNPTDKSVDSIDWSLNLRDTPFRFSDALNKFTVIGCDTLAYIQDLQSNDSYQNGCAATCLDKQNLVNGSCSGVGCCQTAVPMNLKYYEVSFDSRLNGSNTRDFSPCRLAVMLEAEWFHYRTYYSTTARFLYDNHGEAPVVMDWAIGNDTCEVAQRNLTSYACVSKHSKCANSDNGPGYLCNCASGYQGNPYLRDGCQIG